MSASEPWRTAATTISPASTMRSPSAIITFAPRRSAATRTPPSRSKARTLLLEPLVGNLAGHGVGVVAVGDGEEGVGVADPRLDEHVDVVHQAGVEGAVAGLAERVGGRRAGADGGDVLTPLRKQQ